MIIYIDSSWPLWARILLTLGAITLFGVMAWRYYATYWRRRR